MITKQNSNTLAAVLRRHFVTDAKRNLTILLMQYHQNNVFFVHSHLHLQSTNFNRYAFVHMKMINESNYSRPIKYIKLVAKV